MNKIAYSLSIFLTIFGQTLKPMQDPDSQRNQNSSSAEAIEIKEKFVNTWFNYTTNGITYDIFKKASKKALKILGYNQFMPDIPQPIPLDPLLIAAENGDYAYMRSLLHKGANPAFSNINLVKNLKKNTNLSSTQITKKKKEAISKQQIIVELQQTLIAYNFMHG